MKVYFCNAGHRDERTNSLYDPPEPEWVQAFAIANTRSQARWMFSRHFDMEYTDKMQILKIGEREANNTVLVVSAPTEHHFWGLVPWEKVRHINQLDERYEVE